MKTAKEMFEELGFFLAGETDELIWYQRQKKQIGNYPLVDKFKNIEFMKNTKTIKLCDEHITKAYGLWEGMTIQEFLAIMQQMKELGWIE